MTLFLSALCSVGTLLLLLDLFLRSGALYHLLPEFTATLAGLIGVVIAGLEYRARKSKKKKRAPLVFLFIALFAAIAATIVWIYFLLKARNYIP